jgi:hypothetical protein
MIVSNIGSSPLRWFSGQSHVDLKYTLIKCGQGLECSLGKINVLGTFGASGACIDHTYKDTFVRAVTDLKIIN